MELIFALGTGRVTKTLSIIFVPKQDTPCQVWNISTVWNFLPLYKGNCYILIISDHFKSGFLETSYHQTPKPKLIYKVITGINVTDNVSFSCRRRGKAFVFNHMNFDPKLQLRARNGTHNDRWSTYYT